MEKPHEVVARSRRHMHAPIDMLSKYQNIPSMPSPNNHFEKQRFSQEYTSQSPQGRNLPPLQLSSQPELGTIDNLGYPRLP